MLPVTGEEERMLLGDGTMGWTFDDNGCFRGWS